jgi:TatD DNase family protein
MPQLVDTHAHIHFPNYGIDLETVFKDADAADVAQIVCVGTTAEDSQIAVNFSKDKANCVATVGLHPHDAKTGKAALEELSKLVTEPKVVAVGECGLDFYYNHSPKPEQETALRYQIELALKHDKPLIFHVRDAFEDFFRITGDYPNARGVVHSFSSTVKDLEPVLERGFYVGLNGIMTFTKDAAQLEAARKVPIDKLLLETDCPFLTPAPKRGTINEPANAKIIAQFLAELRGESFDTLAEMTTNNAKELFRL